MDYPGAVNATIAASILDLLDIGADDEVLDMTCGSGTFLVEQLAVTAPARAVGVDLSEVAIDAARAHQRAARHKGRVEWVVGDVLTTPLDPVFTRILSNPPWGEPHGEHAENLALHEAAGAVPPSSRHPGRAWASSPTRSGACTRCSRIRSADGR